MYRDLIRPKRGTDLEIAMDSFEKLATNAPHGIGIEPIPFDKFFQPIQCKSPKGAVYHVLSLEQHLQRVFLQESLRANLMLLPIVNESNLITDSTHNYTILRF
jgi:hypothetical protein